MGSGRSPAQVGIITMFKILLALSQFGQLATSQNVVATDKGRVMGKNYVVANKVVSEYLGIPFAKPPLGPLRFAKPVENEAWQGLFNATEKPNACWQLSDDYFQTFRGSVMWNPNTAVSEDCLYLNVWAPNVNGGDKLPVMVWIYGGGFITGSSALDVYDGKQLAAMGNVIVVSMNYRVGALGFLALPNRTDISGNAGLFDQLMALKWVKRNIAAFGGDNSSVTLFGESAGGASVAFHLMSPLGGDLFHKAIIQSGSALSNWAFMTRESANERNAEAFKRTNCTYPSGGNDSVLDGFVTCLRSLSAKELTESQTFTDNLLQAPYLPTVDGTFLVEHPKSAAGAQRFKRVPLLAGSNADEGGYYVAYLPEFYQSYNTSEVSINVDGAVMKNLTRAIFRSYPQWPRDASQSDVDSVVCRYSDPSRPDNSRSNVRGLIAALGDSRFLCSVNEWAAHYGSSGNASVYYYLFNHTTSQKGWGAWTGAMHAEEIEYVFGDPHRNPQRYTADERNLSSHIIQLWTNFARTSIPTDGGRLQWPLYNATNKEYFELSVESLRSPKVGRGPREEYCTFLETCLSSSIGTSGGPGASLPESCRCKHFPTTSAGWSTIRIRNYAATVAKLILASVFVALQSYVLVRPGLV